MITYPNLYHLKYFSDAVELGSISGAAQKNLVTHPAISRAILSLEKHLGTSLMEHQKKTFKLTDAGYRVAEQARVLLSAASEFKDFHRTSATEEIFEIKIGISRTLTEVFLAPLLQDLQTYFPRATAKIRFGTTFEIIEAVASRSVDIGITIGNLNLATTSQTVIRKGQFVLVEARSERKSEVDFESKSFLLTEPRVETEKLKAAYKKKFGRALPVIFEMSSWDVIRQLTQKGLGIGLLPDIAINKLQKTDLKILKSSWFECSYEVYVHTLKAQPPHRGIEHAKDFLFKELE
jgi:DNA-binding transcriptional LysR family regulator